MAERGLDHCQALALHATGPFLEAHPQRPEAELGVAQR
jgi:hypothetical protein